MAKRKSSAFLPQYLQTNSNRQFLSATFDQLLSSSNLRKLNGFVGRKLAPTFSPNDNYLTQTTTDRQNYQLEPAIVFRDENGDVSEVSDYIGIMNVINYLGGVTDRHDRMWKQDVYNYSGLIDLDKLINFSQYYWIPDGLDAVNVSGNEVPLEQEFDVTKTSSGYEFSGFQGKNPTISLARGGNYTFKVSQTSKFWIQTEPGLSGERETQPNFSTRAVLGVTNNGDNAGEVIFGVPTETAQDRFIQMTIVDHVNLATTLKYDQINGATLTTFNNTYGGIDGQKTLDNKKIVFLESGDAGTSNEGNVWLLNVDGGVISLSPSTEIAINQKVTVGEGNTYGNREVYRDVFSNLSLVPVITAPDTLFYYQDGSDESLVGRIKIVQPNENAAIDVDTDILGQTDYLSPNGVQFTNGLKIKFDSTVSPSEYAGNQYYVEGVGSSITLTPVLDLITPETFTNNLSQPFDTVPFDSGGFETTLNSPQDLDYIVMKRDSIDKNPWARHNRWFHVNVITATAEYNNFTPEIDNANRAKRPIIEFDSNLQLFNFGRIGITPVDVIDTEQTDAFSNVEGQASYTTQGTNLTNGLRVIWSADEDPEVRNKVYEVQIIDPDDDGSTQVHMVAVEDVAEQSAVVTNLGSENKGKTYAFKNGVWAETQQKTSTNQTPLFDIFDASGNSYSDTSVYTASDFTGTKIFDYKRGTGTVDTELGFALSYQNFNNVGDIQFENRFDIDTFTYTDASGETATQEVSLGEIKKIVDASTLERVSIWTASSAEFEQYQIYQKVLTAPTDNVRLETILRQDIPYPNIFVYIDDELVSTYSTSTQDGATIVLFDSVQDTDTLITVVFSGTKADPNSYYEIPTNLELNADNEVPTTYTLGQLRNHLNEIGRKTSDLTGTILGANNFRDIGDYKQNPGKILQNASGFIPAGVFLNNENVDWYESTLFAAREYTRFKNKFMQAAGNLELNFDDIPAAVDEIMRYLNQNKNELFPFYTSDMLGYDSNSTVTTYTVEDVIESEYETVNQFNTLSPNKKSLMVYLNDEPQILDKDYSIINDRPAITWLKTLTVGDVIKFVEHTSTDGSFIPATPTKMGMWPKYEPRKFTDDTYLTSQEVIQGHDGSITIAYGDSRDDLLLELEARIYNNLKIEYDRDIFDWYDLFPGAFRDSDYSRDEFNSVLSTLFYEWSANNQVDYTEQVGYDITNSFSWNYSLMSSRIDDSVLPGFWRAIYRDLYDTDRPNTAPWEMLGFTVKPSWWETKYGSAPYTSGNLILWRDLRDGKVWNPTTETYTVNTQFKRADLLSYIPVDEYGQLKSPLDTVVKDYKSANSKKNFVFGDEGPVETVWRRSSDFAFAAQIAAGLMRPGKYFGLYYDVRAQERDSTIDQYLNPETNQRVRFSESRVHNYNNEVVYGYGQWIIDYMSQRGLSNTVLKDVLENFTLNLTHRVAGYTDKNMLKILAEQVSPTSTNSSVFLPDENFEIVLNKSLPTDNPTYSAVIVEKTRNGYTVTGYDSSRPFFTIIPSRVTSNRYTISAGSAASTVYRDFESTESRIPYGTEFTSADQVVDFLVSYQRSLVSRGFKFNDAIEGVGTKYDWILAAKEFLFWSSQGWSTGSIISLSPSSNRIQFEAQRQVVDYVRGGRFNQNILDMNFQGIKNEDLSFYREDNLFELVPDTNIGLAKLSTVQYEHIIVFDNRTVFSDVIYQPQLGNRLFRMRLIGYKTADWDGTLYTPGFILNQDNIKKWQAGQDYARGDIVEFRGRNYTSTVSNNSADSFNFNNWALADRVQIGLLPNPSAKASQIEDLYDIDTVNFEADIDRFGKGITGYQKREYFENLLLDDVTQFKFYQGMIANKGTRSVIEKLTRSKFDNITTNIALNDEWAIREGSYGGTDINQIIEIVLDEDTLPSDPAIVQLLDSGETAANTQEIIQYNPTGIRLVPDGYTKNLFKNRTSTTVTKTDNPTAGYPKLKDVDATLFNIGNLSSLSVEGVGSGYTIWVANDEGRTWNVYRVEPSSIEITGATVASTGRLRFTTDVNHNLTAGDHICVQSLSSQLDGFYTVQSANELKAFTVTQTANNVDFTGSGQLLTLNSVRFNNLPSISDYTPRLGWDVGDLVWVDSNDSSKWAVYKKDEPWSTATKLSQSAITSEISNEFGTSVVLSADETFAVVSSPNDEANRGTLVTFIRSSGELAQNSIVSVANSELQGFGNSLTIGDGNLIAAGASASNSNKGLVAILEKSGTSFIIQQWLYLDTLSANAEFGKDVHMSYDEDWLFVGAPGENRVYVYKRVSPTAATANITADGSSVTYDLGFTPTRADALRVGSLTKVLIPYVDFTASGSDITFTSTPDSGDVFTVQYKDHYEYITFIQPSDAETGDNFGSSVRASTDARQFLVSAPDKTVADVAEDSSLRTGAGVVYTYSRGTEKFTGDGSTSAFTTTEAIGSEYEVLLDGVATTDFTKSGDTITFDTAPGIGVVITIETNAFTLIEKIENPDPNDNDAFGFDVVLCPNDCSVYVGVPNWDADRRDAGRVYRFVNQSRIYGEISTRANPTITAGSEFKINDYVITTSGTTVASLKTDIDNASIPGVTTTLSSGVLTVSATGLAIVPLTGTLFGELGWTVYPQAQIVNTPYTERAGEKFGYTLSIDNDGDTLVIGSPFGTNVRDTTFDTNTTTFDNDITIFADDVQGSGTAYVYQLLSPASPSLSNPSKLVQVQELTDTSVEEGDQFGASIFAGQTKILVGSPTDDTVKQDAGLVYEFENDSEIAAWDQYRVQDDRVDVELINGIFLYDSTKNQVLENLDYIDPTKGKIAGLAAQNIDFLTEFDPAIYSTAAAARANLDPDLMWGAERVGTIWWDLSQVRFIEFEQGTLIERRQAWNTVFPGSSIDVYEWVQSDRPPEDYTGEGTVKSETEYSTKLTFNEQTSTFVQRYYFWVTGRREAPQKKTLSTSEITSWITNPTAQDVPFAVFLRDDSFALFNVTDYLNDQSIVLSIDYDRQHNDQLIHNEYSLIKEGTGDIEFSDKIFNKLIDSLTGIDKIGNSVPDTSLPVSRRYGIAIRPRQNMFLDNAAASKIFVTEVNKRLIKDQYAFLDTTDLLFAEEPLPTKAAEGWDDSVATFAELGYLDPTDYATGYKVLVLNDSDNNNFWTIYELQSDDTWKLVKTQSYNATDYWSYVDWYEDGFDQSRLADFTVDIFADIVSLSLTEGDLVRVRNDGSGKFRLYEYRNGEVVNVAVEDGTFQLSTTLYTDTSVGREEARRLFQAVRDEIFIDDQRDIFNELMFIMLRYVLREQKFVDWIFKTAFISVDHGIRALDQIPNFQRDNQEFVQDFIEEAKPYHTKIREYILRYNRLEPWGGDVSDFDVESYFDSDLGYYRKPNFTLPDDETRLNQGVNQIYTDNRSYSVKSIDVFDRGENYVETPIVTISAPDLDDGVQATAEATLIGGSIQTITVTNAGSGYTKTPIITITGGVSDEDDAARAYVLLENNTTRAFETTIKFDRYRYTSDVKEWAASTSYSEDDLITYQGELYQADTDFTSGSTFSQTNLTVVSDENVDNANDRIKGYYQPTDGMLGNELSQLIYGIEYPGIKIKGNEFDESEDLDESISSEFTDTSLGEAPEDITYDGDGYVTPYTSHAPEEFVPGRVYDTLSMQVQTLPTQTDTVEGRLAPRIEVAMYDTDGVTTEFSFNPNDIPDEGDFVIAFLQQRGEQLPTVDYTIDYEREVLIFNTAPPSGDILIIYNVGQTAEKILFNQSFEYEDTNTFHVPVDYSLVTQFLILVNGTERSGTIADGGANTLVTVSGDLEEGDHVHILFSADDLDKDTFSTPFAQREIYTSSRTFELAYPVRYDNEDATNLIVEVNGTRLRPPNSAYYSADGSTSAFAFPDSAEEDYTGYSPGNVRVYKNGDLQFINIDYTLTAFDGSTIPQVVFNEAPADNDRVTVTYLFGAEYRVESDDQLIINSAVGLTSGDTVSILGFSNHDYYRIQTRVFIGTRGATRTIQTGFDGAGFDQEAFDSLELERVSLQRYDIERTIDNVDDLFVSVDGVGLLPNLGFTKDGTDIVIADTVTILPDSVIIITSFSSNTINQGTTYQMFQDMNGTVTFNRWGLTTTTQLTEELLPTSTSIKVRDATELTTPLPSQNVPGVVFINGERIIYWEKTDTELKQLRRGTAGTGIADSHPVGEYVVDSGTKTRVPDTEDNDKIWYSQGSGTATDGQGLQNSTTIQANFLNQDRGFNVLS